MHILFVVPYTPSLIRTRPYNFIRHLAEAGHQITLLALFSNQTEYAELQELRGSVSALEAVKLTRWRSLRNCLRALPKKQPLQAAYAWQPELAELLQAHANSANGRAPDVIHVEHLRGARFALTAAAGKIPVVWDSVDSISHLFRQASTQSHGQVSRWITRFELPRTESFEREMVQTIDRILVTSELDRHVFLQLGQLEKQLDGRIAVVPNGVDLTYYREGKFSGRRRAELVFSGKMNYHANVTMAHRLIEQIMPIVWAERPDIEVTLVGQNPTRDVVQFGRDPRVQVTGSVPDMRPYLQRASVAVVPLAYGAGVQNKILEAMACGTPVVATGQAIAPLLTQPGRDLLEANGNAQFARTVLDLLADPDRCKQIGRNGRHYVENNHRWSDMTRHLEAIYSALIQAGQQNIFEPAAKPSSGANQGKGIA